MQLNYATSGDRLQHVKKYRKHENTFGRALEIIQGKISGIKILENLPQAVFSVNDYLFHHNDIRDDQYRQSELLKIFSKFCKTPEQVDHLETLVRRYGTTKVRKSETRSYIKASGPKKNQTQFEWERERQQRGNMKRVAETKKKIENGLQKWEEENPGVPLPSTRKFALYCHVTVDTLVKHTGGEGSPFRNRNQDLFVHHMTSQSKPLCHKPLQTFEQPMLVTNFNTFSFPVPDLDLNLSVDLKTEECIKLVRRIPPGKSPKPRPGLLSSSAVIDISEHFEVLRQRIVEQEEQKASEAKAAIDAERKAKEDFIRERDNALADSIATVKQIKPLENSWQLYQVLNGVNLDE